MTFFGGGPSSSVGSAPYQQYTAFTGLSSPSQVSNKPASVSLATLEKANRVLQDQFIKDAQMVPELGETLTGLSFILCSSQPLQCLRLFLRRIFGRL